MLRHTQFRVSALHQWHIAPGMPNGEAKCAACPLQAHCLAHETDTVTRYPVKSPPRERRMEQRTVFLLRHEGRYAIRKREGKGLLAGLWQFPNGPGKLDTRAALDAVTAMGLHPRELLREVEKTHIFTHIQWNMKGIYLEVAETGGGFLWFTEEEINLQAALPTAFRQFWER